jgi:uncharacterized protein DUF6941
MDDERTNEPSQQQRLPGFSSGGPYLALAVLCERVLKEQDGVISVIRIVDRITLALSGQKLPAEMPVATMPLTLVLGFKSGLARGAYTVRVQVVNPSHETANIVELPMLFEGEDRGAQVSLNFGFQVGPEEGLYWFEVYLHDALITKVPLRVVFQRLSVS